MKIQEIKEILMKELSLDELHVISNDGTHFQIIAVSEQFFGMSRVQQQQIIYKPLANYILDQHIHAISIKTHTKNEWERYRNLNRC